MKATRRAMARVTLAGVALFTLALTGCSSAGTSAPAAEAETTASARTPTPLSVVEQLLADAADPTACAVSFVIDGATLDPQLQTQHTLYRVLPIPRAEGRVFAGWYANADSAAAASANAAANAGSPATRVNGSKLVSCSAQQTTLYGAWTTADAVATENARIPILMYHQFTAKAEGESGWLRGNYAYIEDYRAQMQHISAGAFYLPTWDELDAFIDGALFLPDHAAIVTDDDADPTWLTMAAPINEQLQVMATSFDITGDGVAEQNRFILPRSHTHTMHTAGASGQGQMVNLTPAEIAADMEASAAALGGVKEVVAYPYGHHDERSKEGLRAAGYAMARTIEQGYVSVGTDKLALPCIRINFGMDVADLIELIGAAPES